MYNEYFGLFEAPFSIAPDPRYLFMSERHREALAHLLYGLRIEGGFVLLTGEVGTGKTTVCRCLLEQVPDGCDIALVLNPKLDTLELLATLCDELHIDQPAGAPTVKTLVDAINSHLLAANAQGRKTVLIVDEAQNLSNEVLEQLRLLTNLETHTRKLLQIILLGQPELRDRLEQPGMRQLAQRVVARYHLSALSRAEIAGYVAHRLAVAGARRPMFAPAAIKRLFHLSAGTPRLINLICDRALLGAYVDNKAVVDRATIDRAAREVLGEQPQRSAPRSGSRRLATVALVLAAGAGLAVAYRHSIPETPPADPPAAVAAAAAVPAAVPAQATEPSAAFSVVPTAERVTEPAAAATQGAARATAADQHARAVQTDQTSSVTQPTPVMPVAMDAAIATANTPNTAASIGAAEAVAVATTATTVAPATAVTAAAPDLDTIAWPEPDKRWLHEVAAVRALFQRWGLENEPVGVADACRVAWEKGMSCVRQQGDFDTLLAMNTPVIVELVQDDGPGFYATLLGLGKGSAELSVGGTVRTVALASLRRQWNGNYLVLWRTPRGWHRLVGVGARGQDVAWVLRQLERWEGKPEAAAGSSVYTAGVEQRVRAFQRSLGLPEDGVIGVMTMMRLSALADGDAPVLIKAGQ